MKQFIPAIFSITMMAGLFIILSKSHAPEASILFLPGLLIGGFWWGYIGRIIDEGYKRK